MKQERRIEIKKYIVGMMRESFLNYGVEYDIDKDVYERIYIDGIKTGVAAMMILADDVIDNYTINNKKRGKNENERRRA